VYGILVALGTSQDTEIAQIANREHSRIRSLKPSAVKTSYIEAIRQSFCYQQKTARSPGGAVKPNLHAKLCYMFRAINCSPKHLREVFLKEVCSELKITIQEAQDVMYVRYIMENLAFYAFEHPEDLNQSLFYLKQMIKVQQPVVVQGIQDILGKNPDEHCPASMPLGNESLALLQKTSGYIAISIVWEGYSFLQAEVTIPKRGKDFNGAILKYHRAQGSIFLESVEKRVRCLADSKMMLAHCQYFSVHGFLSPIA